MRNRNRSIIVAEVPTVEQEDTDPGETRVLRAQLSYDDGGAGWDDELKPRGYYLTVTPLVVGYGSTRFTLFSGTRVFLEGAKRFSGSTLERIAAGIKSDSRYAPLVEHVLARNGLHVRQTSHA